MSWWDCKRREEEEEEELFITEMIQAPLAGNPTTLPQYALHYVYSHHPATPIDSINTMISTRLATFVLV